MDVPKKVHDIPRPRLFENAGLHPPFSEREELERHDSPTKRERWVLQVKDIRCSVAYPAGWQRCAPSAPDELGVFVPVGVGGPELSVRHHRLAWEVDPLAYLMHLCHLRGLTVTLARPHSDQADLRFELGGTRDLDDARWMMSAIRRDGCFLMVETLAPLTCWGALSGTFRRCRQEFEVFPPPTLTVIEAQRMFRTEHIQFWVPRSWNAELHECNSVHEQIVLSAAATGCRGVMLVGSGKVATPIHVRQQAIIEALGAKGWSTTGRLSTQISGIRTFTGIAEGELEQNGELFHIRISHRRIGVTFVDYTTVSLRDRALAMDEMRTMRAVEIAIDSTAAHVDLKTRTVAIRRPGASA